jgi:hypothetical protein
LAFSHHSTNHYVREMAQRNEMPALEHYASRAYLTAPALRLAVKIMAPALAGVGIDAVLAKLGCVLCKEHARHA